MAQNQPDTAKALKKADKIKKGWNIGGLPVLAYDSDIGFKYGAVINLFNYGDGSRYPKYDHSLYFEWSRTTKGSGTNQFTYDSEHLIPGHKGFSGSQFINRAITRFLWIQWL